MREKMKKEEQAYSTRDVAEDKTSFEKAIELLTGMDVNKLRNTPIADLRKATEDRVGKKTRFYSEWPFIGRGNVQASNLVSRDQVDSALDSALR
jgi:hypothetical protein